MDFSKIIPVVFSLARRQQSVRKTVLIPSRTAFFRRKSKEDTAEQISGENDIRKLDTKFDGPTTIERFQSLQKYSSERPRTGYFPPGDVEHRMERITQDVCGNTSDWRMVSLHDRTIKFKLLTKYIQEFKHNIPNTTLNELLTNEDALGYFSTPVQDRSSYENLAKLDLPRNLHIQQEYIRFDPETDTMFGGKTAFPGSPTFVTGLKRRKKHKGSNIPQYWPDQHMED